MKVAVRTGKSKKRSSSLESYITIVFIILIIIAILVMGVSFFFREKELHSNKEGEQVSISWQEVNLREGPSTSKKIITQLYRGASVTLTGNSSSCIGSGIASDDWVEVELKDGTTGWIVMQSINTV